MPASTKRDVAKSVKTLIVMLQSMRDQQVTVTLRNDTKVTGTIVSVDSEMNIELKDATITPDLFYLTPENTKSVGGEPNKKILDVAQLKTQGAHDNSVTKSNDDDDDHEGNEHATSSDDSEDESENEKFLDFFLIKGNRIRHVDIPDGVDLVANTKQEIERIRGRRKQWTKKDIVKPS